MESAGYVSLEEVKAAARAHGWEIERQWIAKYAGKGLLPKLPGAPGKGRGLGRLARYTQETPRRVAVLIELLEKHGKNLDAVGWDLWFGGYEVAEKYWRPKLMEIAEKWDEVRDSVKDSLINTSGCAEAAA